MRRVIVSLCVCLIAVFVVGGAEPGEAKKKRRRPRRYKKAHYKGMNLLAAGRHEDAAAFFENFLESYPNDPEALFGLAAAYCQLGGMKKAMTRVRQAVEAGLPVGRFLAGPRHWFKPLTDSPEFQEFVKQRSAELVHGPMLGCITDQGAKVWVRTATEALVQVAVSTWQQLESPIKSPPVRTKKEQDFTAVAEVKGLKPSTVYYYDVLVNGKATLAPKPPAFRTFPAAGQKAKFQVVFGGGAGYVPQNERMWETIAPHKPLAFLFLGDNVYIDTPKSPDIQRYCYYRRQSRPEYRRLIASTGIYAVWDDHDFGTNDCVPGPRVREPAWKIPVWRVFCENWNNPYYGGGEEQPGCWFHFSIGGVDFFLTDSRYYRSHPRKPNPSMLGPAQRQWLLKRLKASRGTFRVLANGVPWAFGTKPGSLDPWDGFKEEREQILSFIEQNRIGGVILLSADRHRSDVWRLEREVGYPLYEFESSRLTNQHRHGKIKKALFSYNEKQSFGLLTFDTTRADPEVTYQIINIDSEAVHSVTLRRSQLTPK